MGWWNLVLNFPFTSPQYSVFGSELGDEIAANTLIATFATKHKVRLFHLWNSRGSKKEHKMFSSDGCHFLKENRKLK
jgi:hypothetical protein